MKMLLLDFDGVLCDSIDECLINSYNTFNILERDNAKIIYDIHKIDPKLIETFRQFRPLVRVAREYYLLWSLIQKGIAISAEKDIRSQLNIGDRKLEKFHSLFYSLRNDWMKNDVMSWIRYNPLFEGMNKVLKDVLKKKTVIIVSSKDKTAINTILRFNDLIIDEDRIWGSDSGRDKHAIFRELKEIYQIPFSDFVFLDDNLNNLLIAKKMGIRSFFASWGYSMPNEKALARKMEIPMIRLEYFGEWVGKFLIN